jgi:putative membrane protein
MFWHWSYTSPWWWWFPLHGLLSVIFTVAIIVLIVALFRGRRSYPYPDYRARSQALQILEERYARGEIQRDEYLQKKQDLHT